MVLIVATTFSTSVCKSTAGTRTRSDQYLQHELGIHCFFFGIGNNGCDVFSIFWLLGFSTLGLNILSIFSFRVDNNCFGLPLNNSNVLILMYDCIKLADTHYKYI